VYVPLLVDSMPDFMAAFEGHDFAGFSVTIPHKHAALEAAAEVDPVAGQIGAVNTLVRRPGGGWKGYNTDWHAAIGAIERGLAGGEQPGASSSGSGGGGGSPLKGRTFVVVGAGGAGRALAFGAASRGARVLIANRGHERAEALAAAVPGGGAGVVDWEALQRGEVGGDVLANTTSVGMVPDVEATPVPAAAVGKVRGMRGRRWQLPAAAGRPQSAFWPVGSNPASSSPPPLNARPSRHPSPLLPPPLRAV
jgi:3-dehydroquinate dehydratase/shikimate dehydrogenase